MKLKFSDLSASDKQQLLSAALARKTTDSCYVRDVYDDYFTYACYDGANYESNLYKRTYSIDDDMKVTLGDAQQVIARTVYEPVVMSANFSAVATESAGDFIVRTGKIFEVGEWPDKGFALTADEMAAAAAGFSPVNVDLEHVPTVLDGKLGQLQSVEVKGTELFGKVALPTWLDTLIEDGSRKVSCTWDKATKKLSGLAIVRTPRITDAALYAAFTEFAGSRHSAADQKDIQDIHDAAVKQGATCKAEMSRNRADTDPPQDSGKEGPDQMDEQSVLDKVTAAIKAAFTGHKETPPAAAAGFSSAKEAEMTAAQTRMAAEIAKLRADGISKDAAAFADEMVREKRAMPTEKPAIIAAFTQAATDDAASPVTITFAEGKTGGRVDALKLTYTSRTPHILTAEMLPAGTDAAQLAALFTEQATPDGDKEVIESAKEQAKTYAAKVNKNGTGNGTGAGRN